MGCCNFRDSHGVEEEKMPMRAPQARRRHRLSDVGAAAAPRADVDFVKARMRAGKVAALPPTHPHSTPRHHTSKQTPSHTFDQYELVCKLGKGAFGTVWKAKDLTTGTVVAIKVISKEKLSMDEGGRERLGREVTIMKSLKYKHLVNLYGLLTNRVDNEVWMIVEYVDGCDLMRKLEEGTLDEKTSRCYFQQMIQGLHYVHSQGIAHRDLKPDNILITSGDIVKITDFGLSNFQQTDRKGRVAAGLSLKTCCGTPYYVAPEVVLTSKTKGYSGFTSDTWSLGIILFVMLVGDVPFQGRDLRAILLRITKGSFDFPPVPVISAAAKDCVRSLLVPVERRVSLQQLTKHAWVSPGFDYKEFNSFVEAKVEPADDDLLSTFKVITDAAFTG